MPIRIQRRRTKGWKMPPNTVYVGRGSKWGNPFSIEDEKYYGDRAAVVEAYKKLILNDELAYEDQARNVFRSVKADMKELSGKNLACWCPLDQPCHADVLLALANSPESKSHL